MILHTTTSNSSSRTGNSSFSNSTHALHGTLAPQYACQVAEAAAPGGIHLTLRRGGPNSLAVNSHAAAGGRSGGHVKPTREPLPRPPGLQGATPKTRLRGSTPTLAAGPSTPAEAWVPGTLVLQPQQQLGSPPAPHHRRWDHWGVVRGARTNPGAAKPRGQ